MELLFPLLRYGAKPKESTFVGAAFIAAHDHALRLVRAFLAAGCSVNSNSNPAPGQSPLNRRGMRHAHGMSRHPPPAD